MDDTKHAVEYRASPAPILPPPKLSMKKTDVLIKEDGKSQTLTFLNMDSRPIASCKMPTAPHFDYVDVTLDPYANRDELASVISLLLGIIMDKNAKMNALGVNPF